MTQAGERDDVLIETYRAEAASLFAAGQDVRRAAERTAFFVLTLIGVTVATGISAKSDLVALALCPLTLILMSYMCQQYVDVTTLGAARQILEERIAAALGAPGLIYELGVSSSRRAEFKLSLRLLNAATLLVVAGVLVAGVVVALEGQRWYWEAAFSVTTLFSALSLAFSYIDMLRAEAKAAQLIEKRLA
ncbi:MAG TPA: hypothetical protein VL988_06340 [Solirubrobacteraceae bacterium]|nr:hypothetical protein [Solirubrobacteraceae bacterium]